MMKKKVLACAALLMLVIGVQAFADSRFYFKATFGASYSPFFGGDYDTASTASTANPPVLTAPETNSGSTTGAEVLSHYFSITPTIGRYWRGQKADGTMNRYSLGFEFSIDAGIGATPSVLLERITPSFKGVYALHLGRRAMPYLGLGFGIPILLEQHEEGGMQVSFNHPVIDLGAFSLVTVTGTLGLGIKASERVIPLIEIVGEYGGTPYDTFSVGVRMGVMLQTRGTAARQQQQQRR